MLIVGTGSRADFQNPNKLAQLPEEAREALLRNGAENAVAIGFRTPDTRAAVRLKFGSKTFAKESELAAATPVRPIDVDELVADFMQLVAPFGPTEALPKARRDVEADSETLTALLLGALPKLELTKNGDAVSPRSSEANQQFAFSVKVAADNSGLQITPSKPVPYGLLAAIQEAAGNRYFQTYALKALRSRRTNNGIEIALSFSSGKLRLRDGGPEAGASSRTYVEAL